MVEIPFNKRPVDLIKHALIKRYYKMLEIHRSIWMVNKCEIPQNDPLDPSNFLRSRLRQLGRGEQDIASCAWAVYLLYHSCALDHLNGPVKRAVAPFLRYIDPWTISICFIHSLRFLRSTFLHFLQASTCLLLIPDMLLTNWSCAIGQSKIDKYKKIIVWVHHCPFSFLFSIFLSVPMNKNKDPYGAIKFGEFKKYMQNKEAKLKEQEKEV